MTKYSSIIIVFLMFLCGELVVAQLPVTELFMLELDTEKEISKVSYLSDFNPNAYNNQAIFISENKILLTAELEKGQTDIVQLDIVKNQLKRLTATTESEYSPRLNGEEYFTTVRTEKDGTTQTLWEYPMHLKNAGIRLLPDGGKIGYYYYLPNFRIALFVIEETMNLKIGNMRNNSVQEKYENIGRCFQKNKKGELLFLDKSTDKHRIKSYNAFNQQINDVAPALSESIDFIISGDNEDLLMAKGPQIFVYKKTSSTWILRYDLSEFGLNKITRMDVRDNKILIINNK